MKVLLVTDFSDAARAAADFAAALARRTGEALAVAHVDDGVVPRTFDAGPWASVPSPCHQALMGEADRLRQSGIEVREFLLGGTPEEALVALVERLPVDLVVLAAPGPGHEPGRPSGWNVERIVQALPVSTVAVRSPLLPTEPSGRRLRIVLGVDFTVSSDAATVWVGGLAGIVPCDVVAVHVSSPAKERERFGGSPPANAGGITAEVAAALERDVATRVRRWIGDVGCRVRVEAGVGGKERRFIEAACAENADLVVVGTHHRRGLERIWCGSFSRAVLLQTPRSVACIPVVGDARGRAGPPPEIRRVLAATDLSGIGDATVAYARALLSAGGTVRVVHVMHPRALPSGEYLQGLGEDSRHEALKQDRLRRLAEFQRPELAEGGITTEVELLESEHIATAICQSARRFGADVICMGLRGDFGPSMGGAGSVVHAVMSQIRRPVLVVRSPRA